MSRRMENVFPEENFFERFPERFIRNLELDLYGGILTETQSEVFRMYYCEDMSMNEIGEVKNITRQGVFRILEQARKVITDLESGLGLVQRTLVDIWAKREIEKIIGDSNLTPGEKQRIERLIECLVPH